MNWFTVTGLGLVAVYLFVGMVIALKKEQPRMSLNQRIGWVIWLFLFAILVLLI
jgi:hypothetical protein